MSFGAIPGFFRHRAIGLADDDTVSESNLHRQILYAPENIGKLKATLPQQN
jgi:molybdopterin/thiamine biosynthesis adenylyltransferase